MACEVAPMLPPGGSSSSSAFSPLTLFECTITNAQMLIESMADKELLQALKIAGGLHTHIVGVMEPRYDRACTRSDAHAACLMAAAAAAAVAASSSSSSTSHSSAAAVSASAATATNGAAASAAAAPPPPAKSEDGVGAGGDNSFSLLGGVKEEQLLIEEDSMDDCLILEEDASFGASSFATGAASPRKRPRLLDLGAGSAGAAAAPSHAPSGSSLQDQVGGDCRAALRQAYKELKGNGPHLFNFALPFTDSTNQRVAEQVISHAQRQLSHVQLPRDAWWTNVQELFALIKDDLHKNKLRIRKIRYRQKKLARRQKSFELLATSLSTDQFDKYRILLSRDYTSSDEETEEEGALRVRALPWESAEMRSMKRQLDEAFLGSCATQKQAQQLQRAVREPGCMSGRAPPADCPDWALADEFKA